MRVTKLSMSLGFNLLAMLGLALGAQACGGDDAASLCAQLRECAEKSGAKFSETECNETFTKQREKADTAGCASEYDDVMSCVSGIDFQCSDNFERKSAAECGAKIKALDKCED